MNNLEQSLTDILLKFNPVVSEEDKRKLRQSALKSSLEQWRWSHALQAMTVGGLSGMVQSQDITMISAVMLTDLTALLILSGRAAFGIGHIIDKNEVNYGDDILGILGVWVGVAEAVTIVPAGKIGLKLSIKALPKVATPLAAKLAYKAALKTNSKFAAKLASKVAAKMATKIATKLAAKETVKAVSQAAPWIGGIASVAINSWIINEIMDAAQKYYSNPILALDNDTGELASAY